MLCARFVKFNVTENLENFVTKQRLCIRFCCARMNSRHPRLTTPSVSIGSPAHRVDRKVSSLYETGYKLDGGGCPQSVTILIVPRLQCPTKWGTPINTTL